MGAFPSLHSGQAFRGFIAAQQPPPALAPTILNAKNFFLNRSECVPVRESSSIMEMLINMGRINPRYTARFKSFFISFQSLLQFLQLHRKWRARFRLELLNTNPGHRILQPRAVSRKIFVCRTKSGEAKPRNLEALE